MTAQIRYYGILLMYALFVVKDYQNEYSILSSYGGGHQKPADTQ